MDTNNLLCTFTSKDALNSTLLKIAKTYFLPHRRIFVLQNAEDENQLICTYNAKLTERNDKKPPVRGTISIHRKQTTNTLYTINALNRVIIDEIGKLDNTHQVDWGKYENSILITDDDSVKQIPTKIFKVINVTKLSNNRHRNDKSTN